MENNQLASNLINTTNGTLTGLFSLELRDSKPWGILIDKEFTAMLGLDPTLPPDLLLREFFARVREEDKQGILFVLKNCTAGLKAQVDFHWDHPVFGWIDARCIGIHSGGSDGHYFVRGYFKGTIGAATETEEGYDTALLKNLLSEAMMDSFSVCGITDLENNRIYLVKDYFNIGSVLGSKFTYDHWRDTISGLVAREDAENFDEATTRKSLIHYFEVAEDERHEEFRCLDPKTRNYKWIKLRFVRLKNELASSYKEFFVFRDISEHHHTEFKDSLRIKLINGLTLPYEDIDLVNLKTGRWYTSGHPGSRYAEDFGARGYYDDELVKYAYMCECAEDVRTEIFDKFSVRRMKERFAAGEKIIEAELRRMNTVTKVYEWVRVQASMSSTDEDGMPHMAIVTIQAINAEKEKSLRNKQMLEYALRAEKQYKQAILSSAIAVYTYNVTTDTIYDEVIEEEGINPLLPQLGMSCPCSYDEYINKKSKLLTSKQEAEVFRKTFNTKTLLDMFNSNRRFFDTEYEFVDTQNRKGVYREAVILTQDLHTQEIWGLTYVKNVTNEKEENRRVEQALRDAFYQSQRANSAKTLFMSHMSHDIRTPLNSILGMAAIAHEHIDDKERVADCLNKIEYSGRHLLELINNVLDLSSIESGKTVLATDDFELDRFLEDMLKMIKPLADKRGHTLITDIRQMHTAVNGDRTKLRQVLTNVLSNAIKYTPDGGEIRFTAEELEPDRHDIARYMFTIEDNGVGMPQEFLEKMFDPFVRADDRRTTKVEGTGLGMAIALNIARMMNGNITVRSEVGKGSTFDVTVCLKRGEEHTTRILDEISMDEPKKVRMSDYDFGGRRILLAEDLEFNAEIATEFLSEANLITEVASNGAEAVSMFSNSPVGYYSLIFMDIQMPELDGNEAAKKIRALARDDAKTIPIIAMTANAFVEDVKKAKEHGMNGHIAKPLEIARLVAELKHWFGDKKKRS